MTQNVASAFRRTSVRLKPDTTSADNRTGVSSAGPISLFFPPALERS
jgi:hypothetical protein